MLQDAFTGNILWMFANAEREEAVVPNPNVPGAEERKMVNSGLTRDLFPCPHARACNCMSGHPTKALYTGPAASCWHAPAAGSCPGTLAAPLPLQGRLRPSPWSTVWCCTPASAPRARCTLLGPAMAGCCTLSTWELAATVGRRWWMAWSTPAGEAEHCMRGLRRM